MDIKITGPGSGGDGAVLTDLLEPLPGMTPEEFSQLARSVVVVIPHRTSEGLNSGLLHAARIWAVIGMDVGTVEDNHMGFIEVTRAGIVKAFINFARERPQVRYLVMIDSDESVQWDAPLKLARWDLPVVSGVVCSVNSRGLFACFTIKDEYGVARFPSLRHTQTLPAQGLRECHSVGTGLICIRKDVFETIIANGDIPFKIPEKERDQSFDSGVLKLGEDTAFSRTCEKYGFKRYVDFSVRGTHYKTLAVDWPKDAFDPNMEAKDWKVDVRDYAHV